MHRSAPPAEAALVPPLALAAFVVVAVFVASFGAGCNTASPPPVDAAGAPLSPKTRTLEAGAEAMQPMAPVTALSFYVDGFHVMKGDPGMQMEAHHFCNQVNEEFTQCVIFDGNTRNANLIGVEYMISQRLFDELPAAEQASWHPHNYEILSGSLVAPGLPDAAEKAFMAQKMNSYGKTWHIWDTGHAGHRAVHALPVDEPRLAWSPNADGELDPALVAERDARMGFSTAQKRAQRQDLTRLARPQQGVDALADAFPERTPIAGVREERAMGK